MTLRQTSYRNRPTAALYFQKNGTEVKSSDSYSEPDVQLQISHVGCIGVRCSVKNIKHNLINKAQNESLKSLKSVQCSSLFFFLSSLIRTQRWSIKDRSTSSDLLKMSRCNKMTQINSSSQVPPQAKNTITLGEYDQQRLTPKTQTGTIGIHNVTYILQTRFGNIIDYR